MKEFKIDLINRFDEFIIDEPTNTYVSIKECKNIEEVKLFLVFSLCRPIGKGLEKRDAIRLLDRFNSYFKVNLSREDMKLMYSKLCTLSKLKDFQSFIDRGFPIEELKNDEFSKNIS